MFTSNNTLVDANGRVKYYRRATNPFVSFTPIHTIHSGKEYLCTHEGISQYSEGGSAACGLAALNCARIVLDIERKGIRGDDLIMVMLERKTMQDIMSICTYWPNEAHFELEDIYRTPLFEASLHFISFAYQKPSFNAFMRLLNELENHTDTQRSCAVIFTRPPEIVVCLRLVNPRNSVYAIFDSHPRPDHPNGAAFIFFTSAEMTARYIAELLPVDESLASDSELQWEVQLLSNLSAHLFQAGERDLSNSNDALQTLCDANFSLLRLRVQEETAKTRTNAITAENVKLQKTVRDLEADRRRISAENEKLQKTTRELETELRTLRQKDAQLDKKRADGRAYSSSDKGKGKAMDQSMAASLWKATVSRASDALPSLWSSSATYNEAARSDPGPSGTQHTEELLKQKEDDSDMAVSAQIDELKAASKAKARLNPTPSKVDLAPERRAPGGAYGFESRSRYSDVTRKSRNANDVESKDRELAYRLQMKYAKEESSNPKNNSVEGQSAGEADQEVGRLLQLRIAKEEAARLQYNLRTENKTNYDAGYNAGSVPRSTFSESALNGTSSRGEYNLRSRKGSNVSTYSEAYARRLATLTLKEEIYSNSASTMTNRGYERVRQRAPGASLDSTVKRSPSPTTVRESLHDVDMDLAMRLQLEFNNEDEQLRAQFVELQAGAQVTFACTICMEEVPEDFVARVNGCKHSFCRDCLRGHVVAQISENKFPIGCPSCSAEKDKGKVGVISEEVVRQLGIEEKEFAKFDEMQMIAVSVPIECRKCKRAMFVDRREFEDAQVLTCPLPKCAHSWCKVCQQPASANSDPPHSCDGTNEFNHLMGAHGWKRCPGCGTPTEKIAGCDHMTCRAPGCNVHFCYRCGGNLNDQYNHTCPGR